ncbi:alpha-L-rhamnosidase [Kineococcus sp. SYSU DK003]|uniref:alpha-L-rhamnosidase n=1 Tax=Kineococcus sp. SYSU DK003 TaxID=3383124 RepID=UPI003D7DEA7F
MDAEAHEETSEGWIERLTVERMVEPLAVAADRPVFGWTLTGTQDPVGYEIVVSDADGDIWASGAVHSPDHIDVPYAGTDLRPGERYGWRVRALTAQGRTPWVSSWFGTAPVRAGEWDAPWLVPQQPRTVRERYSIGDIVAGFAGPAEPPSLRLHPPRHVRQSIDLVDRPVRALLSASARGIYTAEINGHGLEQEVLAPGYDAYASRLSYQTYEVTDLLTAGRNVIGLTVADGWWAGRVGITGSSAPYGDQLAVTWRLQVQYADGRRQVLRAGDTEAHGQRGGHDYADLFIGERFDTRAVMPGWSSPGFPATGWAPVQVETSGLQQLTPFVGEPVVRTELIEPSVSVGDDGSVLLDAGQVLAGRLRVRLRAPRDAEVTFEHSEVLTADGSFFDNIVGPNKDQLDVLVCDGSPELLYEPVFTFHGFRYARISSSSAFELFDAQVVVLGSDLRPTTTLVTSDERINQLHRNIVWSQRGNFLSIPTDCPQRERAGWTGDFQIFTPTAATLADIRQFAARWLANVRAEQGSDGSVPTVVPVIPSMQSPGEPVVSAAAGWSDAIVMVPWALWQRCADRRVLQENYEAMRRWVDYQQQQAECALPERYPDDLDDDSRRRLSTMWNTGWQFGDWLAPSIVEQGLDPVQMAAPSVNSEVVAAMFHAHSTRLVAQVADVLGYTDQAEELYRRAETIREAFAQQYVSADGRLPLQLQGLYVLALAFELVPSELRQKMVIILKELIEARGGHLDTGFLSTPYLLDVLWDAGEHQLARDLLWQPTAPSWLYAVDHGATSVWESWEAVDRHGNPTRSSFNHYAFGCVDDWMLRRLGGIESLAPGYARVRVAPDAHGPLEWARTSVDTVRGALRCDWSASDGVIRLDLHVPPGVSAEIDLGTGVEVVGAGRHERAVSLCTVQQPSAAAATSAPLS